VVSALRGNELRGIGGSTAKVVFAVGADAEVRGVPIEAGFNAGLEGVGSGGEGDVLTALKEIAVGLHDRAGIGIEGFIEAVVEFDGGIRVVGGRKAGRGAGDADGGLKHKARRDGAGVSANDIALMVVVLNAEGRIDGGLIRICGGAGEIVEIEAREELIFV
jgi:hypothetical protein